MENRYNPGFLGVSTKYSKRYKFPSYNVLRIRLGFQLGLKQYCFQVDVITGRGFVGFTQFCPRTLLRFRSNYLIYETERFLECILVFASA